MLAIVFRLFACLSSQFALINTGFSGVRVAQSLIFCVVFCIQFVVPLPFFVWSLYCMSFDLRLLVTSLLSLIYGFWLPLWYLRFTASWLPLWYLRFTASWLPLWYLRFTASWLPLWYL